MSTEPKTQVRAVGGLLQRVELAGQHHRAARARRLGLHQVDITALEHLATFGPLTPGELGHRLGLTSGGVTALIGRLIDAGSVCRDPHPNDGRMRLLQATEAGEERLRSHIDPVLDVAGAALSRLSDADAMLVEAVLELLASAKSAAAAATPGPERECSADPYSRALLM